MGLGGGMMFVGRADAGSVTQQDWCVGACGPLRSSSRALPLFSAMSQSRQYSNTAQNGAVRYGGVLELLESLGNVSDHAIDAITNAPAQANPSGHDALGNQNAAQNKAAAASRRASKWQPMDSEHADFQVALNGCVLGCEPSPASHIISSAPVVEEALFIATGMTGTVLPPSGVVNTIVNPEPSTVILMLSGLAAMAVVARRKMKVS